MARDALQTGAERRPITPCSFPPGNKRPAVLSIPTSATEPHWPFRAWSG